MKADDRGKNIECRVCGLIKPRLGSKKVSILRPSYRAKYERMHSKHVVCKECAEKLKTN